MLNTFKNLLQDENFMIYHIIAFGIYFLNISIYDILIYINRESAFAKEKLSVEICDFFLIVTNLLSQLCLYSIMKKHLASLL